MEVPRRRPILVRLGDRDVLPLEEVAAAVGLAVAELSERELVEAVRGLDVLDADRDVIEDVQHRAIVPLPTTRCRGGRLADDELRGQDRAPAAVALPALDLLH